MPRNIFVPPERRLYLVDIENLAATGRPSGQDVVEARRDLEARRGIEMNDQVVIGCNPANAVTVAQNWPGARYVIRGGENGADLALLDVIANESVPLRFSQVTIASGDAIFADAITYLSTAGCHVSVVARNWLCSHLLWRGSEQVTLLPAPHALAPSNHRPQPVAA